MDEQSNHAGIGLKHPLCFGVQITEGVTTALQVDAQAVLIARAESDLQMLADERRQLTAKAAHLAAQEESMKAREAEVVRRDAELSAEAAQ